MYTIVSKSPQISDCARRLRMEISSRTHAPLSVAATAMHM